MIKVLLLKQLICNENFSFGRLTSDLQMHWTVHGQGQRQEVEGVEASTDVSACLTLHLGLELAVEEVHHDGTVPTQVVLPRLQGGGAWTHEHRAVSSHTTNPVNLSYSGRTENN